jgi:nitrite reductase/ring-hydroxylating ferredoxin subunit
MVLHRGRVEPAFAIRCGREVHAYLNRCAHRLVELDWEPGQFFDAERRYLVCATHGALYEPASGTCVAGPCRGAALVAVPVRERDGAVWLADTSGAMLTTNQTPTAATDERR